MERTTLAAAGISTAVKALTRAYTGYFVPIQFTEAAFARYVAANDIVLDASPVWLQEGVPAAVGVTGIRGRRGWVGAFGVAPEFRGKGLAQAMFGELVRHIKRCGVDSIQLEVLDQNERAIRIYQRAGFAVTRTLFTLESPQIDAAAGAAGEADPGEVIDLPDETPATHCWQRERRSLELRLPNLRAVRRGSSYALFRADGGDVSILKAAVADADATALFAALAAHSDDGQLAILNEPEGSPLLALLTSRAWTPLHRQYEMQKSG